MNENIDAITANKIIQKTLKEYYEKENKKMSNKANLGKSLTESLEDAYEKFSKWVSASQKVMEEIKSVKEAMKELKEIDDAPVELTKVSNETVEELNK